MKKILFPAIAIVVTLGVGTTASAATATWNFEKDATDFRVAQKTVEDPKGMEGTFSQVYAGTASGGASTKGSITLSADAYIDANNDGNADTNATIDPFMDAYSAGLGVCKTGFDASITNGFGGESQCSTGYNEEGLGNYNPGDDNLVSPEVLKLTFSVDVAIDELFVRNGQHNPEEGTIYISTSANGVFDMNDLYSINDQGMVDLTGLAASKMFWFTSGTDTKPEIYLSTLTVSAVPVPAALPLLFAGLSSLGFMGRRRRKAA